MIIITIILVFLVAILGDLALYYKRLSERIIKLNGELIRDNKSILEILKTTKKR